MAKDANLQIQEVKQTPIRKEKFTARHMKDKKNKFLKATDKSATVPIGEHQFK